jgi:hypothetical protein
VPWWGWAMILLALLVTFDRSMVALERRGHVYWRRSKAPAGTASTAMLAVQALLEPAAEHVVEERRRRASEVEEASDDDPLPSHRPHVGRDHRTH